MEDGGMSEVLGEILMLTITLTLVAVFSANLSSLIPSVGESVYAVFKGRYDGNLTIQHVGGESLPLSDVRVVVRYDGNTAICRFSGEVLYCNAYASGVLLGDGDNYWEFGETLELSPPSGEVWVTIACGNEIVDKLVFDVP